MDKVLGVDSEAVEKVIADATEALLKEQRADGHWVFELEADATIPSEYVLLVHYLGETPDLELERKIGVYLRRIQSTDHGGWPLFHDGAFDLSATVKAYFALKMIGDDPDAPHMKRARDAILKAGGALKANVFTRIQLALYGECAWKETPSVPAELILLPRWFPIHLSKMSYWARTVIVPLLVLQALKPLAKNKRGVHVPELFLPARRTCDRPRAASEPLLGGVFRRDRRDPETGRAGVAERACASAPSPPAWSSSTERLNGEDGLGAIYPAMANSVMMFDALGYKPDHPDRAIARRSVEKLLVVKEDEAYCQPCVSPVWDTALAAHALMEAEDARGRQGRAQGARLAEAAAGSGCRRRLGRREAGCAPRRLGLPVSQRSLSRSRRHRRGGDGAGPRAQACRADRGP